MYKNCTSPKYCKVVWTIVQFFKKGSAAMTEISTHKLKKFRPSDKGKVLKELIIHLVKVDKAIYYCTLNKMKRNQTWLRKGNFLKFMSCIFSLTDCN